MEDLEPQDPQDPQDPIEPQDPVDPPQDPAEPQDPVDPPDDEPSRGERRIQALANEKAKAQQEAQEARRQADFYRAQAEAFQRQQQPQEDLDPMVKWQRDTNLALQQHQFLTLDLADKADFKVEIADRPDLRPYADEVEQRLQTIRQNGGRPTRKQVLTVILGERAMDRMAKAPKAKADAAQRVRQATGKPLGSPSSVTPGKRDTTLYDRLKDIPI